jgi:Skp family chaperone for outer membrane proteins
MKARFGFFAALAVVAAVLAVHARSAVADDNMPPLKVAVCDPTKILPEIQEGKDLMAQVKQDQDTLQAQAKQKQDDLQSMSDKLKLMLVTSAEYQTDFDNLIEAQANAQAWLQANKVILARKERSEEQAMFDKILKAIAQVAQQKGCTLVVNSGQPPFPDVDHMDAQAFFNTVMEHTCLYSDQALDITQDVIIAMDKSYTATPTTNP